MTEHDETGLDLRSDMLNVVRLGVQEHLLVHLGVLGDPVVVQGEGGREGDDGGGGGTGRGAGGDGRRGALGERHDLCRVGGVLVVVFLVSLAL